MRPSIVLLALFCAAGVAGCSSSSRISSSDVKDLVLTKADLPSGFEPFAEGPTASLDVQGTTRANLERFGRQAGWVARLRRAGTDEPGPVIVVSTVDVFAGSRGAQADLEAYANNFVHLAGDGLAKRVVVRDLGDGAVAARLSGPGGASSFQIAWIERNATASVMATGLAGQLKLAGVVALARRQETKLDRA